MGIFDFISGIFGGEEDETDEKDEKNDETKDEIKLETVKPEIKEQQT